MTTLATDGKTIASDSQATGSFRLPNNFQKLHYVRGSWIGFTGSVYTMKMILDWMRDGALPERMPRMDDEKYDWEALELTADGRVFSWSRTGQRIEMGAPYASGSGQDFAMAAMLAGATAGQAVGIASELDPFTGGPIVVADAGVAPGEKKKRAKAKPRRARSK